MNIEPFSVRYYKRLGIQKYSNSNYSLSYFNGKLRPGELWKFLDQVRYSLEDFSPEREQLIANLLFQCKKSELIPRFFSNSCRTYNLKNGSMKYIPRVYKVLDEKRLAIMPYIVSGVKSAYDKNPENEDNQAIMMSIINYLYDNAAELEESLYTNELHKYVHEIEKYTRKNAIKDLSILNCTKNYFKTYSTSQILSHSSLVRTTFENFGKEFISGGKNFKLENNLVKYRKYQDNDNILSIFNNTYSWKKENYKSG